MARKAKESFVIERFSSLDEYLSAIGSRPMNDVFKHDSPSSERKESSSSSFTGTRDYGESVELIRNGFKEGLTKMIQDGNERLNLKTRGPKAMPSSSPVGYAPIVPNALLGLPNSMISTKHVNMKSKVLSICYDMGASCGVSVDEILSAGRHLLELIDLLEKNGYRVALWVGCFFCSSEQVCAPFVKVKTDRQPMNPLKIAYPILHASYLRRQGFKWLETNPKVSDNGLLSGYGKPLRHFFEGDRRKYLLENGVIDSNCFFTDHYETCNHTAKQLMELMGLKKEIIKQI